MCWATGVRSVAKAREYRSVWLRRHPRSCSALHLAPLWQGGGRIAAGISSLGTMHGGVC